MVCIEISVMSDPGELTPQRNNLGAQLCVCVSGGVGDISTVVLGLTDLNSAALGKWCFRHEAW